jgi:hypothetical protein
MTPDDSIDEFERYAISLIGGDIGSMTLRAGVDAFLGFFRDVPADGCLHDGGDMLQFASRQRDYGKGERFEASLVGSSRLHG